MPLREQSRIPGAAVAAPQADYYSGPIEPGMVFEYKGGERFVPDGRRGKMGELLDAQGNGLSEPNLRGLYRPVAATQAEVPPDSARLAIGPAVMKPTDNRAPEGLSDSRERPASTTLNPAPEVQPVPTGYRLGDGWKMSGYQGRSECFCAASALFFVKPPSAAISALCPAHAAEVGALVPILQQTNIIAHHAMDVADANARVQAMQDAAYRRGWSDGAKATRGADVASLTETWVCGYECGHDTCCERRRIARRMERMSLPAQPDEPPGEVQPDAIKAADGPVTTGDVLAAVGRANIAIKAAVTAANNRAADAFIRWDNGDINVSADDFAAWLRSGAPDPVTVKP